MAQGIKFKTEAERKEGRRLSILKYNKSEKVKQTRARYEKSEKGKLKNARYNKSEKGKQKNVRYEKSEKGKQKIAEYNKSEGRMQANERYRKTEKGKQAYARYNKKYYLRIKDTEEFKKKSKVWRNAWKKANIDRHKAIQKAWTEKRLRTDPSFKIKMRLRSRVGMALKNQKAKKYYHFNEVIGCSPKELKDYLERKFRRGMTWENYSPEIWHIDHIIACSKFDLTKEEEQRKCFHYSNLRPLWAKHNLQKGSR